MRTWPIVLALAACGHHASLLDADPAGAAADQLWDLAPDGTEVGLVASPKAIGLVLDGVTTVQQLIQTPEFAPMKPTAEALISALVGAPNASPADAGLAHDQGFAMFVTTDGVLGVMPVGDRDKFMGTKHGTRGEVDMLNGNTCKPVGTHYMCATNPKLFDRVGKASLRGKAGLAGGRGDVEMYAPQLPLFGGSGDLAVVVELERGALAARGVWTGKPGGTLGILAGTTAPKPDTANASGFVSVDVAKLLANLPAFPIAGGVTAEQFGKSLVGPVSAVIPAGSVDVQITAALNDIAPAKTLLEHCKELNILLDVTAEQPKDACRFKMQSIELEVWVDEPAKQLRVGAHRGPATPGAPATLTPIGAELAHGTWTAMFWGRGTMLNLTGIKPSTDEIPPAGAAALHAISLVNELGAGLVLDDQGIRFRGVLRTAWANPPELAAAVVAIPGADIVHGVATEPARALAAANPSAPFAGDFAAGQGGLLVPAGAMSIAIAIILPAIESLVGEGGEPPSLLDEPPPGVPGP